MQHGHIGVVFALGHRQVGTQRAIHRPALGLHGLDSGLGDGFIFVPEQAAFAGVRIDPHDAHTGLGHTQTRQGDTQGCHRLLDQVGRDALHRADDAFMQGHMRHPQILGLQQQEGAVFGRVREIRDQPAVARERNAGVVDRGLAVRGGADGGDLSALGQIDRRAHIGHGGRAGRGADRAGLPVWAGQRAHAEGVEAATRRLQGRHGQHGFKDVVLAYEQRAHTGVGV